MYIIIYTYIILTFPVWNIVKLNQLTFPWGGTVKNCGLSRLQVDNTRFKTRCLGDPVVVDKWRIFVQGGAPPFTLW